MSLKEKRTRKSMKKSFRDWFLNLEMDVILISSILLCIFIVMIIGVIFLFKKIYVISVNIGKEMVTWDVVIVAAIIAGLFSLFHAFLVKWLESISRRRAL